MIHSNVSAEYKPEPEYKVENNCLYRKLMRGEVIYYLDELERLHIASNAIWLDLSSCSDSEWIEEKKKEFSFHFKETYT